MRRVLTKTLWGAGALLLLALSLLALSALFLWRTDMGLITLFAMNGAVGPVLLILIAGVALSLWRWRRGRNRLPLVVALVSGAGAAACLITLIGLAQAARAGGVPIDIARVFVPGPFSQPGPRREEHAFDRYDGEEARVLVWRPAKRADGRAAPIITYVHGGGWIAGNAADREHDWQWLANRGYLVIAINYTLSDTERRHLWDVTQPQIGCGLSWIGQNAARLGGDVGRIALLGESAGGNLVLNVGGMAFRGELPSRCGGKVPSVAAIISVSPPTDLVALYNHPPGRHFAEAYTGSSPARHPEHYAAVSPIVNAAKPAPPLLLMTGMHDGLVLAEQSLSYAKKARAAGNRVELITVSRGGHGFEVVPGSIGHQIAMKATEAFLKRQGLAP